MVAVLDRDSDAVDALMIRMVCIPRIITALDRVRDGALGPAGRSDAEQESRLRIWRDLESFNGSSKLETWMYRYCFNVYREFLRRKSSASGSLLEAGAVEPDKIDPDRLAQARGGVPEGIERMHQRRLLWQAVDALPQDQKAVVAFKHLDDMSFAEIANATGVSINTLKARYYKARRTLRVRLDGGNRPPRPSSGGTQ